MVELLKAALVAEEEVEFGLARKVAEGTGDAVHGVGLGAFGGGVGEETGFDGPEPPHSPDGDRHFLDVDVIDIIAGTDFFTIPIEEGFEDLGGLVGEDDQVGEEAMAQGVPGRALFAGFGFGAAGESSVGARCNCSFG